MNVRLGLLGFCFVFCLPVVGLPAKSLACDLHAVYSSLDLRAVEPHSLTLSVAEQFTLFDRIQNAGAHVQNEQHQRMESSITQFVAEYDFSEKFGLQVALPYVHRSFRRVEGGTLERGTESGIGDLTVLGKIAPYNYRSSDLNVVWHLFAGLKLPTGNTDRLAEEFSDSHHEDEEHEDDSADHGDADHDEAEHHSDARHGDESHGPVGAIHGHDLSLGSGSYDFPFGGSVLVVAGKWLADADLSYTFRTGGDFGYRYDNDFLWRAGAGYYCLSSDTSTLFAKLSLSGEIKGKDEASGVRQDDTGIRSIFWGPTVGAVIGESLSADLGAEFPLDINNTGLQAVASYRLKAALSYRF
jgi:hypothetical protein